MEKEMISRLCYWERHLHNSVSILKRKKKTWRRPSLVNIAFHWVVSLFIFFIFIFFFRKHFLDSIACGWYSCSWNGKKSHVKFASHPSSGKASHLRTTIVVQTSWEQTLFCFALTLWSLWSYSLYLCHFSQRSWSLVKRGCIIHHWVLVSFSVFPGLEQL